MSVTKNLPALVIACVAMFIALGGPSHAADVLGLTKNSVKSKHIDNGQVKSADIAKGGVKSTDLANGEVGLADISDAAEASLAAPPAPAEIPDNAVNSAKVADDTLTGSDVLNNTLTESDIGSSAVGGAELAPDSVETDEVMNGSLDGVDIGRASGVESIDFANIAAGSCDYVAVDVGAASANDQVTVSPEPDFNPETAGLTFYGMSSPATGYIRFVACNVGGAAIDLGPVNFHYTVIDN
jgi:hypothetical protein